MRRVSAALSLLLATGISAATVEYKSKETVIGSANAALEFKGTSECVSPLYADWDGDGVRDLLCGYWKGTKGFVRFYKNEGTTAAPEYTTWEHISHSSGEVEAAGG